jgi:hypothetical protein
MDDTAQSIGRVIAYCIVLLIFGLPLYRFFRNSLRDETKSRRQANLAIACGLLFFVLFVAFAWLTSLMGRSLTMIVSSVQVLVGTTGVVLAIASLKSRAKDEGTGFARSVVGLLLSVLHAIFGLWLLYLPVLLDTQPDPRTAWSYSDPTHGVQVKLPSNRWRQVKDSKGEPAFVHARPRMKSQIISTNAGQTLADYEVAARNNKAYLGTESVACRSTVKHREGTTPNGNPFTYSTCMDSVARTAPSPDSGCRASSGKNVFVAASVVFCKDKGLVVLMFFEGQPEMVSEFGRDLENQSFETAAAYILQSVE